VRKFEAEQDNESSKSELCDDNKALEGRKPQEIRSGHYHLNDKLRYSWILINAGCERDIVEDKQAS